MSTPQQRRRSADIRRYTQLRRRFLERNPWCGRCGTTATEVHHKRGRVGDLLCAVESFMAICHSCHVYVTANPAEALERGWSLPRIGESA